MSEFDLNAAIQAAKGIDAVAFKDSVQSALANKVSDALDAKKMELAGNFLKTDSEDSEQETEQETETHGEE
jgi:hypothetical protein